MSARGILECPLKSVFSSGTNSWLLINLNPFLEVLLAYIKLNCSYAIFINRQAKGS